MRIGIIGCGTIAQIMHMPYVREIPAAELYALSDPATDRLDTLGDRYNVSHRFSTPEAMIAEVGAELDGVIVLTPPQAHAEVAELTLEAEIPTLVEKPLAISVEDAERMVERAETTGTTAMVAYMKRYSPAYEQACEEVAAADAIDLVTAYDVDPDHGRILEEVYDIVGGELPDEFLTESQVKREADAMAAIDTGDAEAAADYDWHLEHACHDVNVLRGLFGDVERIEHVDVFADGRYATAHLVYEGGVRCVLESGLSERNWFEEFVRVDTPDRLITLEFSNPFIRNSTTELRVKDGRDGLSDERRVPSYEENFKRELQHFFACIRGDATVRTSFVEACNDVRLVADLFREHRNVDTIGCY